MIDETRIRFRVGDFIKFVDADGEHWWIESYLERILEAYIKKLKNNSLRPTITEEEE